VKRWKVALLLAAAGLLTPSAAAAEPSVTPVAAPIVAGPVLVQGRAVVLDKSGAMTAFRAYGDRAPHALAAFAPLLQGPREGDIAFAGSPTRLVVARTGRFGVDRSAVLASGPLAGPVTAAVECPTHVLWRPLVLDGDRLLYTGPSDADCRTQDGLRGRDLATGATFPVPAGAAPDAFAWPYAAWIDRTQGARSELTDVQLVERDLSGGGGEVVRFRLPDYSYADTLGNDRQLVALDHDGTVAVSYFRTPPPHDAGGCYGYTATVVASPAQPSPRSVDAVPCYPFLALHDGRLAALERKKGADADHQVVTLTETRGGAPKRAITTEVDPESEIAFDGSRIAYRQSSCVGTSELVVASVDEPAYTPASCPVHVVAGRALLTSAFLTVRLSCPRGCSGEIGFDKQGRYGFSTFSRSFVVSPGARTVRVRVSAADIAKVRKLRGQRIRLGLYLLGPSGTSSGVSYDVRLR
jgi:hypothetical protein